MIDSDSGLFPTSPRYPSQSHRGLKTPGIFGLYAAASHHLRALRSRPLPGGARTGGRRLDESRPVFSLLLLVACLSLYLLDPLGPPSSFVVH